MKLKLKGVLGVALTLVLLASLTVGLASVPAGAASSNLKFVELVLPKVEAYDTGWETGDAITEAKFATTEGDFWCTPGVDPGPIAITPDGDLLFAAVTDNVTTPTWYEILKSSDGGYSWTVTGYYDDVVDAAGYNDATPIVDIVTSPEYADDTTLAVATESYVYISEDGGKTFTQLDTIWTPGTDTINDLDMTIAEDGDQALVVATDEPEVYVTSGLLAWTAQSIPSAIAENVLACAFLPTFADDSDIGICAVTDNTTDNVTTMTFSFADISVGGEWGDAIKNATFVNADLDPFDSVAASIGFPDDFDAFGTGNNVCFVGIVQTGDLGKDSLDDTTPSGSDAYQVKLKEAGTSTAVDLDVRGVLTTLAPTATAITSIDVCGEAEEATILVGTDCINMGDAPEYFPTYLSEDSGDSWEASAKCPTGGTQASETDFKSVNTRVLMAPDFCDSGLAYASTQGAGTSAFQCTTDANESWNQISIVDYAHPSGYTITPYGFNAYGYNADDTLWMITQTMPDSFSLTADNITTTVKVEETVALTTSVSVLTDSDLDVTIAYDGVDTYTITLPDVGDAVLVSAGAPATNVKWTQTAGTVAAAKVTDNDGDMTVGGSGVAFDMPDASDDGALWGRLDGSHWERILSYAYPGVTDNLYQLQILSDGSAMFAIDLSPGGTGNDCMWRSTDLGATWPKKISTKDGLTSVWPVSTTTIYTSHVAAEAGGSGIWWSERAGTGWEKPEDSDIPATAMVASVTVTGDIVTCGTWAGAVYISSDAGENVERVGSSGPFSNMVLEGQDLGFADNGILYAASPSAGPGAGVFRAEVDLSDPGDAEWIQIDAYQDSTDSIGTIDSYYPSTNFTAGSPPLCLPPSGILYFADSSRVDKTLPTATTTSTYAGGLWRSTNPTADTDSTHPPYFERENYGLPTGTSVGLRSFDFSSTMAPTFFFAASGGGLAYYEQIAVYTDTLNVGVTLATPDDGATGVGLLPENTAGDVYPVVTIGWEEMAGATGYQYQVSTDPDFKTKVLSDFTDDLSIVTDTTLLANNTYYWRVRVANEGSLIGAPLISPWSATYKFKTVIGVSMQRPALQAPDAGETGVTLSPTFEWSGIEWAEDYEFELALDPATTAGDYFTEPLVALVGADALVSTAWKCDITLDYSTRYYWHVKAIGVDTDTPWSDVGTFTTMEVPAEPTTEAPPITIPPTEEVTPAWIWAVVIIGAVLVISVIVLIVTTRRAP